MGDVFKTRDVLYEIPGGNVVSMRHVRGVYIAGPYLPIHYENNLMMVTNVQHIPVVIVDYTQQTTLTILDSPNVNQGHGSMALCDMDFSNDIRVTYYSLQNKSIVLDDSKNDQGHGCIALCDMDFSNDIRVLLYTSDNKFTYLDNDCNHGSMALCDMDFSTNITHKNYYLKHEFIGHDDCIMIRSMTVTKATITDGT